MDATVSKEWVVRFNDKWTPNENGCWIWTGSRMPKGYGQIKVPGTRLQEYAHRLSWRIHHGAIPPGVNVLHRCDNPPCVNPAHLFLGDAKANALDMKSKGRHLFGERNARHVLTAVDVHKIKAMLATGLFSQAEIGRQFSVHQTIISKIHRGEMWAHIK